MAPGSLKGCHIVALKATRYSDDFTPQNLKKWIEAAGGHAYFKEKLTEQTTHVVMDEDTWTEQGPFVQEILNAEVKRTAEHPGRTIHVVSFDWLGDSLDNRIKRGESNYKWKNLARNVLKDADRSSEQQAKQQAVEEKQPGNVQGLMAQAFLTSTDDFVDVGEKRRMEKRKRQEAEDRAEELEEEKRQFEIHRKKMSVQEQAAVFRKGAKRARNDILSDNHHIYTDNTGFPFDVTVTKVNFTNNTNERYVLTLYESNDQPCNYAFNCSFAGTNILPRNDVIAAIGSNYLTAFRAFRKVFKEKTGVEWDDRITAFKKREAGGGGPDLPFDKMPFEYYPPKYGPVGELPLAQVEAMEAEAQAAKPQGVFHPTAVVDNWKMSGANGSRNVSPGFNAFMNEAAKDVGFPPGDELNGSPFQYPFELSGGENEEPAEQVDAVPSPEVEEPAEQEDAVPGPEVEEQSYHFDDALGLGGSLEMDDELFMLPNPEYVLETQGGNTQVAEHARAELLGGSPEQQGVAANEICTTTAKETQFETQGGQTNDGVVDLGLEEFV